MTSLSQPGCQDIPETSQDRLGEDVSEETTIGRLGNLLGTPAQRVRVGFSLAIETLLLILVSLLISGLSVLHAHAWIVPLGFGLLGAVLLGLGPPETAASDPPIDRVRVAADSDSEPEGEHPLAFLSKSRYWGWLVTASIIPIILLCFAQTRPAPETIPQPRARKVVARAVQPPPPAPPPAPPAVPELKFPDLKVSGIICNGAASSAVINGFSIAVGKRVENVTLVAVETSGVVVEMNGLRKLIPLGD